MVFSCLCSCHSSQKSFFCLYKKDKSSESKVKFRHASNHCKRALEATKPAYANKTKESITSQKLGSQDFCQITISVLNKGKSVVSKVLEKLVNNRIVDHVEKYGLFSDIQYGFRSSRSTADLLTVVSDRIARAFNRSGATRAVALDISKAFHRVWHAGFLHILKSYGVLG